MPHLRLLGSATLEAESGGVSGLTSRRYPLALLALLATAASRTLSRSKLVGLLWPESPEATARNRLNTYVHQVRSQLGEAVLVSIGDDLRLDPGALACDVTEFREALAAGDYGRARELYGGPFLDGFSLDGSPDFEHHVILERARVRHGYHEALEALAEAAETQGEPEAATELWLERAQADPYDSRVALRLMQALEASGNRAAALRVAHEHRRLLKREFDTTPSPEIRDFVVRLKRDVGGDFPPPSDAAGSSKGFGDHDEGAFGVVHSTPREDASVADRLGRKSLFAGLLAVAVATVLLGDTSSRGAGGATEPTIAVLPFETLGEEVEVFADGLHSDLSTRLAGVAGLDVISRGSVLRYEGSGKPTPEIGRELGSSWVVEGDVQRFGDEIRLNARLVDAGRDRQAWSGTYRRPLTSTNLFEIQAEIARSIVRALAVELTPDVGRRMARVPTRNIAAYELYHRARYLDRPTVQRGTQSLLSDRKIELYTRALELDPEFAEAWSGLADAYVERVWGGGARSWADSAKVAARRALEIDPGLADAFVQLGDASWASGGPVEEQLAAYRRALELEPSNAEAVNNLVALLHSHGRIAEAMKWLDRAHRLSPAAPGPIESLVTLNLVLGRDDVAGIWLERLRERGYSGLDIRFATELFYRQDLPRAREILEELSKREEVYFVSRRRAVLALYDRDWKEARRHYRDLYPGVPRASGPVFKGLLWDPLGLAYALDRLGNSEEAREIAEDVVREAERGVEDDNPAYSLRHRLAVAHVVLGDTAAAMEWLERAVDAGYRDARTMRTIPVLDPVRDHPRFHALLKRMETLVSQERREVESEDWGVSRAPRR